MVCPVSHSSSPRSSDMIVMVEATRGSFRLVTGSQSKGSYQVKTFGPTKPFLPKKPHAAGHWRSGADLQITAATYSVITRIFRGGKR